jgi:hypothetical protein
MELKTLRYFSNGGKSRHARWTPKVASIPGWNTAGTIQNPWLKKKSSVRLAYHYKRRRTNIWTGRACKNWRIAQFLLPRGSLIS